MFDFVAVFFSSCSIVNGYLLWLPPTCLVRFTVHFPSVTCSTHQKARKSNNLCRVVYFVRQFCGGNDREWLIVIRESVQRFFNVRMKEFRKSVCVAWLNNNNSIQNFSGWRSTVRRTMCGWNRICQWLSTDQYLTNSFEPKSTWGHGHRSLKSWRTRSTDTLSTKPMFCLKLTLL